MIIAVPGGGVRLVGMLAYIQVIQLRLQRKESPL